MIEQVGKGKYILKSRKTGKNLSKPVSKKKAKERERQVNYFKYNSEVY